jgi:hypothetical protein
LISLVCPSCGHENFDPAKQCVCGYHADEAFTTGAAEKKKISVREIRRKELKNLVKPKSENPVDDVVIKEVDSWAFSFSPADKCIYLGTPALQSFKLTLTLDDLEELLESVYQHTGEEKTIKKLRMSAEELPDLIEKVYKLIEDKRSKMNITFELHELQEIADLITTKLND